MIYLGSDHRGFSLKGKIKEWLEEWEKDCQDLGNHNYNKDDDYVDWALKVAKKVAQDMALGILICGSGIGVSVMANKIKGIRAGLCTSVKQSRKAVEDDNINILCLSANFVNEQDNQKIVKMFLNSIFSGDERHFRRLEKIRQYESKNC
ncbi:ribose-5-phosphate isomerase [Candidatus Shapirobacteria bacterium]|nr:MAG: ribose-5-phosphate isomerase [Candidatus Shapirobacteria bacterium]